MNLRRLIRPTNSRTGNRRIHHARVKRFGPRGQENSMLISSSISRWVVHGAGDKIAEQLAIAAPQPMRGGPSRFLGYRQVAAIQRKELASHRPGEQAAIPQTGVICRPQTSPIRAEPELGRARSAPIAGRKVAPESSREPARGDNGPRPSRRRSRPLAGFAPRFLARSLSLSFAK